MKALIKDNKVCDVVENEFPVTDEFTWVDCDNTVKQGFSYDGSTFTSNEPTAEEIATRQAEEQAKNTVPVATDDLAKSMSDLAKSAEASRKAQSDLLSKLQDAVDVKDQDLKDLKRENDLSEQGIYLEPKPFKSTTAENRKIEAIKADLENTIQSRSQAIKELKRLKELRGNFNKKCMLSIADTK